MRRLGATLIDRGLITPRDLDDALAAQKQLGGLIGLTLVRLGALSEADLLAVLSDELRLPVISAEALPSAEQVKACADRVHASLPWLLGRDAVIWFQGEGQAERLHCASRHPMEAGLQEAVEQWSRHPTIFYLASQQNLERLLEDLGKEHEAELSSEPLGQDEMRLREMAEEAPVIDFVNAMFNEAIQRRASDIHIEPFEDRFAVRLRADGILAPWRTSPRSSFDAVASRVKLLSGMDIAERRLPQDGRQSIRMSGKEIDLRVSSLPTTWGESLVLRLLGKTRSLPELSELGVEADHVDLMRRLVREPNGIVLVTGPTGSGKTTTIYRLLGELNDGVRKIVTVEDPVEFDLPGVMQVNVRADIGLTFAAGLRSILRQDPDVILVGEIRDSETARIAVQAALTGHLVISTVHTNSALAAIPRLLDLGVEEFLLADVVRGVIGQRLVRKACAACGGGARSGQPRGCAACGQSGFLGRLGIYEVIAFDQDMADGVRARRSEGELAEKARAQGMRDMREDGQLKVRAGLTTQAEMLRVIGEA